MHDLFNLDFEIHMIHRSLSSLSPSYERHDSLQSHTSTVLNVIYLIILKTLFFFNVHTYVITVDLSTLKTKANVYFLNNTTLKKKAVQRPIYSSNVFFFICLSIFGCLYIRMWLCSIIPDTPRVSPISLVQCHQLTCIAK